VSLGGGAWGYYGCQHQITNRSSCLEIEYPTTQWFECTPIGKLALASQPPAVPPGGEAIPLYECPGMQSLGGGAWGFYGCQGQITNTETCLAIEYPRSASFPCGPIGTMVLLP
jgi:hypothetical protein